MPALARISLDQARKFLGDPVNMYQLLDILEHQSPDIDTQALSPLVLDVVKATNPRQDPAHDTAIMGRLLKLCPSWVDMQDNNEETVLMHAVRLNKIDLVELLLAAAARVDKTSIKGLSALDVAAHQNSNHRWQQAMADALLEGASFTQQQKDAALCHAAAESNLGMVRSLFAHGAGFSTRTMLGIALVAACDVPAENTQSQPIVELMLQERAARDLIDKGQCASVFSAPLNAAASHGNLPLIRTLIAAGASVNPPPGVDAPLMRAGFHHQFKAVRLLVESGAKTTAVDQNGRNILHHLARGTQRSPRADETPLLLDALDFLVSAGADLSIPDFNRLTPADVAISHDRHALANAMAAIASSRLLNASTPACRSKRAKPGPRL